MRPGSQHRRAARRRGQRATLSRPAVGRYRPMAPHPTFRFFDGITWHDGCSPPRTSPAPTPDRKYNGPCIRSVPRGCRADDGSRQAHRRLQAWQFLSAVAARPRLLQQQPDDHSQAHLRYRRDPLRKNWPTSSLSARPFVFASTAKVLPSPSVQPEVPPRGLPLSRPSGVPGRPTLAARALALEKGIDFIPYYASVLASGAPQAATPR